MIVRIWTFKWTYHMSLYAERFVASYSWLTRTARKRAIAYHALASRAVTRSLFVRLCSWCVLNLTETRAQENCKHVLLRQAFAECFFSMWNSFLKRCTYYDPDQFYSSLLVALFRSFYAIKTLGNYGGYQLLCSYNLQISSLCRRMLNFVSLWGHFLLDPNERVVNRQ